MARKKVFRRHRAEVKTPRRCLRAAYDGTRLCQTPARTVETSPEKGAPPPDAWWSREPGRPIPAAPKGRSPRPLPITLDVGLCPFPDARVKRVRTRSTMTCNVVASARAGRTQVHCANNLSSAQSRGCGSTSIVICGGVIPHRITSSSERGRQCDLRPGTNIPAAAREHPRVVPRGPRRVIPQRPRHMAGRSIATRPSCAITGGDPVVSMSHVSEIYDHSALTLLSLAVAFAKPHCRRQPRTNALRAAVEALHRQPRPTWDDGRQMLSADAMVDQDAPPRPQLTESSLQIVGRISAEELIRRSGRLEPAMIERDPPTFTLPRSRRWRQSNKHPRRRQRP